MTTSTDPVWVHREEERRWRWMANCRGRDPNIFVPEDTGNRRRLYAEARKVCAGCLVDKQCGAWADAHHESLGMWGGLSPVERVKKRREGS